jgi:8-oxo-dGTP diphosphatase
MNAQNNIHVLSRAVIIGSESILLVYDPRSIPFHYYEFNKTFYYLPGGHINFQESARDAVVREIKEESGYNAIVEKFLGTIEHSWSFPGDELCCHTHEVNLIFKANIPCLKASQLPIQQEEHVAFKWILLSDLQEIDLRPKMLKDLIPKWLNSPLNNSFKSEMI